MPGTIFTRSGRIRAPYNPELEKFWFQRRALFSRYDDGVRLDAESWYSVTPELIAIHVALRLLRPPFCGVCVDAFCGVGGNAIQLALSGARVLAIDIDGEKVAMARHNARVYGVAHLIEFVVGDFLALAPRLRANAVFLSPPWGGVGYDAAARFDLETMMEPCAGSSIFEAALAISSRLCYYLPRRSCRRQIADLAARHPSRRCELERAAIAQPPKKKRKRDDDERGVLLAFFFDADSAAAPGVHETSVGIT